MVVPIGALMMSLWVTTYDTQKHVCAFTSPVHGRSWTPIVIWKHPLMRNSIIYKTLPQTCSIAGIASGVWLSNNSPIHSFCIQILFRRWSLKLDRYFLFRIQVRLWNVTFSRLSCDSVWPLCYLSISVSHEKLNGTQQFSSHWMGLIGSPVYTVLTCPCRR